MRFAAKMSLAVAILLVVALSLGGTVLVRQNFADMLDVAVEQNIGQHLLEKYSLENELVDLLTRGEDISDENLVRYGVTLNDYLGEGRKLVAIYGEELGEIYANLPATIPAGARRGVLEAGAGHYTLAEHGGATYMLVASLVENPRRSVWLLSGYDISRVFEQRDGQMMNLWRIGGVTLAVGILLVVGLSMLLTRHIRRLSRVSHEIAGGAYSVRTGITGNDEIADLAKNFDEMAAAVEQRVDQLSQSVQARDDFVSAFSHELKTPMTSIIGYSDFVRSMETDPKTRHIAANHIFHEAQRLEMLSQKLLSLMGLSEQPIEPGEVKVASIYAATQRSLLPLPDGIALAFEPTDTIVRCDKVLVVDLLRNLVLNAIKSEPKDHKVRIFARIYDARCHISVVDTGCGIAEDELARITEPFYMVDKSRAREAGGTGVGLALCNAIARLHGGELHFKSRVGEGTLVSFSLELWRDLPREEAPADG